MQDLLYLVDSAAPDAADAEIIELYAGKCVHCWGSAHGIHELIPRSICQAHGLPWQKKPNRVTLCALCHDWAQVAPLEKASQLRVEADRLLTLWRDQDE